MMNWSYWLYNLLVSGYHSDEYLTIVNKWSNSRHTQVEVTIKTNKWHKNYIGERESGIVEPEGRLVFLCSVTVNNGSESLQVRKRDCLYYSRLLRYIVSARHNWKGIVNIEKICPIGVMHIAQLLNNEKKKFISQLLLIGSSISSSFSLCTPPFQRHIKYSSRLAKFRDGICLASSSRLIQPCRLCG